MPDRISYPAEGSALCQSVEDSSFWFQHRNDVIVELATSISATEKFYDVGGGNGCVSMALQRAGVDVVLVEPNQEAVDRASDCGVQRLIPSRLEETGLEDLKAVGLFDVIEHIEQDSEYLRMVHERLAPGGVLYLTVPAHQWLWSADDVHAGHFRRYTARLLATKLRAVGYRLTYCGYLFSFLIAPIFVRRTIPSWLGLRKISAKTIRRDHSVKRSVGLVRRLLRWALGRVRRRKRIPFGSTVIAVARKN